MRQKLWTIRCFMPKQEENGDVFEKRSMGQFRIRRITRGRGECGWGQIPKWHVETNCQYEHIRRVWKGSQNTGISNKYLSELEDMEKWKREKCRCAGVQFQTQWVAEEICPWCGQESDRHRTLRGEAVGSFCHRTTMADYLNTVNNRYAYSGKAMMSAGIFPIEDQLESMGWTPYILFFIILFVFFILFFNNILLKRNK